MEDYSARHDDVVRAAVKAVRKVRQDAVMAAFVGSLSTRNLPARSPFGSFVVLQHFQRHKHSKTEHFDTNECAYCGLDPERNLVETPARVENYPFQVRHSRIQYSAFDLATFADREVNEPTAADEKILQSIFAALRKLPKKAQLTELHKALQGLFKSNKWERMILLETFGYAGIHCPAKRSHYSDEFTPYDEAHREAARGYKMEWEYPIRFWTGQDGVNEDLVERYFGEYL